MTLGGPTDSGVSELLSRRTVPIDMVGVSITVVAMALLYTLVVTTPVRFLLSVPLLLFLPGYVLVGILFPRTGRLSDQPQAGNRRSLANAHKIGRVTLAERIALSFGLSVAVVPLLGLLLELLPVDAFDGAIGPTLVGFVLVGALIASIRRLRVPQDERFRLPVEELRDIITASVSSPMPRAERIATVTLAATVLLAMVSVGYAFAVPQQGEQFTDLRVMTESSDGETTLGNYPDEMTVDQETEVVIGVDNREGKQQEYTVIITAEQLIDETDSVTSIETTEIDRFETTLANGERLVQPQTITPDSTGEYRINYYLYTDDPPDEPDAESAYRHVHFTTSTVSGDSTTADGGQSVDGDADIGGSVDAEQAAVVEISQQPPARSDSS